METPEVLNEVTSGLGPELTRWTARAAAGCWAFWLLMVVAGVSGRSRRVVWTAGLVAHLAHVFCAFHFIHHWSHAEAVLHTARLTERVTGWGFGQGVWINYVFTLAWLTDVVWWWSRPVEMVRSRGWSVGLHWVFAFLFFNATVVFGPWGWKPIGAGVVILLGVAWKLRRKETATGSPTDEIPSSG